MRKINVLKINNFKQTFKQTISVLTGLLFPFLVFADETQAPSQKQNHDIIEKRMLDEKNNSAFLVSLYEPTYILPFHYSHGLTEHAYPDNHRQLKNTELNFQISFKVPAIKNILDTQTDLYLAYTQKSFWQAYENSPYFRETNYQPEIFLSKLIDYTLGNDWKVKFINIGAVHQSNGEGGVEERSWNRIYTAAVISNPHWMITFKPWYIIKDNSVKIHNPDIGHYLGNDSVLIAYKYHDQTFSIERTNLESGLKRGSIEAAWSFPLTKKIKGYTKFFSGYGQSLSAYNHHTNSIGIGIALNDWI